MYLPELNPTQKPGMKNRTLGLHSNLYGISIYYYMNYLKYLFSRKTPSCHGGKLNCKLCTPSVLCIHCIQKEEHRVVVGIVVQLSIVKSVRDSLSRVNYSHKSKLLFCLLRVGYYFFNPHACPSPFSSTYLTRLRAINVIKH